ncbi:MAG TPA: hypothetical protein VJA63_01045 [Candidatus Paceibacterota bacterium]
MELFQKIKAQVFLKRQRLVPVIVFLIVVLVAGMGTIIFSKIPKGEDWKIEEGNLQFARGAHMGTYGDFNQNLVKSFDPDYFEYLRGLGANWVGISVALFVDDSLDSTVERKYQGVDVPTYKDDDLRRLIRELRDRGFHVYLTLALEDAGISGTHPYHRSQLGLPQEDGSDWPWNENHPDRTQFVSEFWRSYSENAVHFAQIAQEEGVEMYSLGTETEGLFRTRDFNSEKGGFIKEIGSMLSAVRQAYQGKVTYDMHAAAIDGRVYYHQIAKLLWEDINFDVIGISAYFSVLENLPNGDTKVSEFERGWQRIFENYLIPLASKYPDKPLMFLEYSNKTSLYAGYEGEMLENVYEPNNLYERNLVDRNGNSIDDAQEQQANMHQALFNVIARNEGVLDGIFFWGEDFWDKGLGGLGYWDVGYWDEEGARGKEAEKMISKWYQESRSK